MCVSLAEYFHKTLPKIAIVVSIIAWVKLNVASLYREFWAVWKSSNGMLTLEEGTLYLKWLNSCYALYVQTFSTKGFLIWIFPAQHREVKSYLKMLIASCGSPKPFNSCVCCYFMKHWYCDNL